MKANKIIFEAKNDHVFNVRERPIPAAKLVPEWWKNISKYIGNKELVINPAANITVKQCAPTIDMFTSGYIITLCSDILVRQVNYQPLISHIEISEPIIDAWPNEQLSGFRIPDGFSTPAFKYLHGWNIKTPPGWSTMFIHPPAYENLPIRSIAGIVDTDILTTPINCPFFIKDGFEGVIEKGTPMVQLIPFKRESWESEFTNPGKDKTLFEIDKLKTKIYGYYSSKRARKIFK
jgi:hypothetical protein